MRTQGRILRVSKQQIEKRIEKLKKRMNKLYVEVMAAERALQLFAPLTQQEVDAAKDKETQLREQIVAEVSKVQQEKPEQPTGEVPPVVQGE